VGIDSVDVSVGGVRSRVLASGPADACEAVVFVAHDFGGAWARSSRRRPAARGPAAGAGEPAATRDQIDHIYDASRSWATKHRPALVIRIFRQSAPKSVIE
jgi:hypothetical protein